MAVKLGRKHASDLMRVLGWEGQLGGDGRVRCRGKVRVGKALGWEAERQVWTGDRVRRSSRAYLGGGGPGERIVGELLAEEGDSVGRGGGEVQMPRLFWDEWKEDVVWQRRVALEACTSIS